MADNRGQSPPRETQSDNQAGAPAQPHHEGGERTTETHNDAKKLASNPAAPLDGHAEEVTSKKSGQTTV